MMLQVRNELEELNKKDFNISIKYNIDLILNSSVQIRSAFLSLKMRINKTQTVKHMLIL